MHTYARPCVRRPCMHMRIYVRVWRRSQVDFHDVDSVRFCRFGSDVMRFQVRFPNFAPVETITVDVHAGEVVRPVRGPGADVGGVSPVLAQMWHGMRKSRAPPLLLAHVGVGNDSSSRGTRVAPASRPRHTRVAPALLRGPFGFPSHLRLHCCCCVVCARRCCSFRCSGSIACCLWRRPSR